MYIPFLSSRICILTLFALEPICQKMYEKLNKNCIFTTADYLLKRNNFGTAIPFGPEFKKIIEVIFRSLGKEEIFVKEFLTSSLSVFFCEN